MVSLEFSELFKETIYDFLSSLSEYLSQNGFRTILRFKWDESKVCINYEYLVRIFDNISSNIIKYASSKQNIYVTTSYDDTYENEWKNRHYKSGALFFPSSLFSKNPHPSTSVNLLRTLGFTRYFFVKNC